MAEGGATQTGRITIDDSTERHPPTLSQTGGRVVLRPEWTAEHADVARCMIPEDHDGMSSGRKMAAVANLSSQFAPTDPNRVTTVVRVSGLDLALSTQLEKMQCVVGMAMELMDGNPAFPPPPYSRGEELLL